MFMLANGQTTSLILKWRGAHGIYRSLPCWSEKSMVEETVGQLRRLLPSTVCTGVSGICDVVVLRVASRLLSVQQRELAPVLWLD